MDSLEGCQTQKPLFSAPPSALGGAHNAALHLRHFSETLVSMAALSRSLCRSFHVSCDSRRGAWLSLSRTWLL